MAAIPKRRMYRALNKAGLANPKQLEIINRKLGNDPRAQREFQKLWREKQGHRFSNTLIAFAGWLVRHWAEIKIALGIVMLFLDEEPEAKPEVKKEEELVLPPKPKRKRKKDEVPALVTNESIIPARPSTLDNLVAINNGDPLPEVDEDTTKEDENKEDKSKEAE